MRIIKIEHDSIVDGEGLRTVIYFAGCEHQCKGCHNPETWDFNAGRDWTLQEVFNEIKSNPLSKGVTFSGGDCLFQAKKVIPLAKLIKKMGLNLWIYTGFTLEYLDISSADRRFMNEDSDFIHRWELIQLADVVVDGRYIEEERDLTLAYRGSRNQRILYKGKHY